MIFFFIEISLKLFPDFTDDILNGFFFNFLYSDWNFFPDGSIDGMSSLMQPRALCWTYFKPLSEPMMTKFCSIIWHY